jgi:hypothetical protein
MVPGMKKEYDNKLRDNWPVKKKKYKPGEE